ncbi:MAG: hypothetical protein ACJ8MR_17555 [Povalibacter sp.]
MIQVQNVFRNALFGLTSLLACSLACADTPSWVSPDPKPRVIEDTLRIEVNLLSASIDTKLRIDETLTLPGTDIDAEDDLGLDDSALMPQAEITLLPGEHHLLRLSGFNTRRSASHVIDEEIFFDDEVYEPGERVDSQLDLTMFGLTYGHRFIVRDRGELTATFGIQIADVDANAVVRSRVVREAESGVAPLPMIGLEGRFDFSSRWSAEARIQYLSANIKDVDGSIMDARLALTWRANPYLVFGLGYRSFSIEVDSRTEDNPGLVDLKLSGPVMFARASL